MLLKDQKLDEIVQRGGNVAQFVSFGPDGKKRYSRIRGTSPTHRFTSIERAIQAILDTGTRFVNIRSFKPNKPDGNPFFMGYKEKWASLADTADVVRSLISQGLHVIVNEDIPVNDGGFSGVMFGEIAEFAPCDTPRCVEGPGCAVLPRLTMMKLAHTVYGHHVSIPFPRGHRVEFSVHPGPVGYFRQCQLLWQQEEKLIASPQQEMFFWPNRYSRVMGDKAYGLLMAHLHGFRVPYCRVTGRIIPPFEFGEETGSREPRWVRSCPYIQKPGKHFTNHGWLDVIAMMQRQDPSGTEIASWLEQDCIDAQEGGFSGAAITGADGKLIIEGTPGYGDRFMVGEVSAKNLPEHVIDAVTHHWEQTFAVFGPIRFEWVYDTKNTMWFVQLHCGKSDSYGSVIYPGERDDWKQYYVTDGLEGLRKLLLHKDFPHRSGITLIGDVGITSHFGDILRRAHIPSRLERGNQQ